MIYTIAGQFISVSDVIGGGISNKTKNSEKSDNS